MSRSIVIIGAGMGGLAAGIYGQRSGFATTIFEAHHSPGGQCTSWTRNGYVFDSCLHYFGRGGGGQSTLDRFWEELGVFPCEMATTHEVMSAVSPDGTWFRDYYDLEKLESHMKQLSPDDAAAIDGYINDIRGLIDRDRYDVVPRLFLGSRREKLSCLPGFLSLLKHLRCPLEDYAKRFRHPFLRKAFPLLHYSAPNVPVFFHLVKHADASMGGKALPKGGGLALARKMASLYERLGGTVRYRQKVVRILTESDRACGVELEDGSRQEADLVVSNADGRKTIMAMLGGRYVDKKTAEYCKPNADGSVPFSVMVFLGVKRDLSSYPSALLMFLDRPEVIAGHACDHLGVQMYGSDPSMAPAGKGVVKVELFSRPSYFARLHEDKAAYKAEKDRIAEQVIALLEKRFPGLREDIEVIDVATLHSWERYMGGTQGFNNCPNKGFNILETIANSKRRYRLPGLGNFFFVGQWATSAGALFVNAFSGKTAIKMICRETHREFRAA